MHSRLGPTMVAETSYRTVRVTGAWPAFTAFIPPPAAPTPR
jgi:hypothetical protein